MEMMSPTAVFPHEGMILITFDLQVPLDWTVMDKSAIVAVITLR